MSVSGVGWGYNQNYVIPEENTKNANDVEKAGTLQNLSEAEEMELFKKKFYAELERIPKNGTIINLAVNISGKAFENMKADPEYRAKILSALLRKPVRRKPDRHNSWKNTWKNGLRLKNSGRKLLYETAVKENDKGRTT